MIAWAKGTANANLRPRTLLLGDIVNSSLGAALPTEKTAADLLGDTSYTTYLSTKANNMSYSLLTNANDGFFNVIDAGTGARKYAYMPSTSLASLATISATSYGSGAHKFTVDGQISVFDTQSAAGSAWRTVAYSGLGAGGKALFAIRLFEGTADNVGALWEVKAPDASTPPMPSTTWGTPIPSPMWHVWLTARASSLSVTVMAVSPDGHRCLS